jgi:hypothetical protein
MAELSVTAHADLAGLFQLAPCESVEHRLNLAPQRDDHVASLLLRTVVLQILMMNTVLADAFDDFLPSSASMVDLMEIGIELGLWPPRARQGMVVDTNH